MAKFLYTLPFSVLLKHGITVIQNDDVRKELEKKQLSQQIERGGGAFYLSHGKNCLTLADFQKICIDSFRTQDMKMMCLSEKGPHTYNPFAHKTTAEINTLMGVIFEELGIDEHVPFWEKFLTRFLENNQGETVTFQLLYRAFMSERQFHREGKLTHFWQSVKDFLGIQEENSSKMKQLSEECHQICAYLECFLAEDLSPVLNTPSSDICFLKDFAEGTLFYISLPDINSDEVAQLLESILYKDIEISLERIQEEKSFTLPFLMMVSQPLLTQTSKSMHYIKAYPNICVQESRKALPEKEGIKASREYCLVGVEEASCLQTTLEMEKIQHKSTWDYFLESSCAASSYKVILYDNQKATVVLLGKDEKKEPEKDLLIPKY